MKLVGNVQLVAGDSASLPEIFRILKSEGIDPQGNPDVYVREYVSFGVDDARELGQRANTRAIASTRRVFIIVTPGMTIEAQNTLLKTLEEPSADALFFFIIASPETLIPTVRSRAQMLMIESERNISTIDPIVFIRAPATERMDMLKSLLEKGEDEKRDLHQIFSFLDALERILGTNVATNTQQLRSVYRVRTYLGDKGSLVKVLLEQVALLA